MLSRALVRQARPLRTRTAGDGQTFTITSRVLGEVRTINVYRPPLYGDTTNRPRPVLYVPDGGISEDFLFDTYIAVDPSLWWNDAHLISEARRRFTTGVYTCRTLYLASSAEAELARLHTARSIIRPR